MRARFRSVTWTRGRVFLAVFGPLLAVYLSTTMWGPGYGVDAMVNLQTAYHLANE